MAEKSSQFDELTRTYHRNELEVRLKYELERHRELNHPFSLVMLDMDDFKKINDTYGHEVGDQALRHLVKCIYQRTRRTDLVFRYGGDEFLLFLPEADRGVANTIVERIQLLLLTNPLLPQGILLKVSTGIVSYPKDGDNLGDLLKRADQMLYQAKSLKKGNK